MRIKNFLHKIKVRHVAVSLLLVMFVFLILSHNTLKEPDKMSELGQGLTPLPKRKYIDAVRYSELPSRGTLERLKKVNLSYEMIDHRKVSQHEERLDIIKKIRQEVHNKTETDDEGNIKESKALIDNLYNKNIKETNTQAIERDINVHKNPVTKPETMAFNPGNIFSNDMEIALNKTTKRGHFNNMLRRDMNNKTRKNLPFAKMNKDLDNPAKTLNLRYINHNVSHLVKYKKEEPIIWVTGHPRSGTTLMRAMLDAHPEIRCGEETHIIPRILGTHSQMMQSDMRMGRLTEANIDSSVLMDALGAYVMTVIAKHGEPANRLCNKDPFTISSAEVIRNILPNSKFLFMIRDGRAVAHSVLTREVSIQGFDRSSYVNALRSWNGIMSRMLKSCRDIGADGCLPVYYEQLVLHPRYEMKKILQFLDISWDEIVLHHEQTVGKKGGVSLSMREFSTDQVEKPINMISLTSWVDHFPEDAKARIKEVAPLLESLGYDIENYPPIYGEPDHEILQNTQEIQKKRQLKKSNSTETLQNLQKN